MKIKKSQLKSVIKSIVREAIAEQEGNFINEGAGAIPPGKLSQLNPNIATNDKQKKLGAPTGKLPVPVKKVKEAGLTSEDGGEHNYDEREEILLIKVMELIAKKLSAMHGDKEIAPKSPATPPETPESPEAEEPEAPESPEPFPADDASDDGGGETEEEPSGEEDASDEEEIDEASYKVVAPRAATDAKEDKARRIQTEPKVNEASFKIMAKKAYTDAKEDKARRIQTEPDVNEAKVQKRSYVTVKDTPMDPENVRDPEVPMTEAKKK